MKYAGIGSRETPHVVLAWMRSIAAQMAEYGYTLRTGGAPGADQAFMQGAALAQGQAEIFLPWPGFEIKARREMKAGHTFAIFESVPDWAKRHWAQFHPAPEKCSAGAQALMARNSCQVLGHDGNSPSDLVICYTPGGAGGGGTGQALRIARHHSIPVVDMGKVGWEKLLISRVPGLEI